MKGRRGTHEFCKHIPHSHSETGCCSMVLFHNLGRSEQLHQSLTRRTPRAAEILHWEGLSFPDSSRADFAHSVELAAKRCLDCESGAGPRAPFES